MPPKKKKKQRTKPAAAKRKEGSSSRRVLIVDDNEDAATALGALMKRDGWEVRLAFDGPQGIKAADEFRPTLLILDIGMPKVTGFDVCRRVREQPWGEKMIIIALTGWSKEEYRSRSEMGGFDAYVLKPVEYEALRQLIVDLLPA